MKFLKLSRTIGVLWLLLAALSGCAGKDDKPKPPAAPPVTPAKSASPVLTAELVARNNRGVGLMAQLDYVAAAEVFQKLVDEQPGWLDAKINLAIALLNDTAPGTNGPTRALVILQDVLDTDPQNPRANYCTGRLLYYNGKAAEALPHFRLVAEADPADAFAAYFTGRCLFDDEKFDDALGWYQKSLKADPYFQSAYYGLFQTLQRLGRADEAKTMLADFERLGKNPQAKKEELKYTRMGPKAMAITVSLQPPPPLKRPDGPLFEDPAPLPLVNDFGKGTLAKWISFDPNSPLPSITVCDIDGDGRPDIFIAGAIYDGNAYRNAVLLQRDGGFYLDMNHPLAQVTDINAVLWGDYDNDGLTDVYFCRRFGNQLWRQTAKGEWQDVTQETHTAGGRHNTVDGAFIDADHDGDLDLFLVNAEGPNELLNNNLDGTFKSIAEERRIDGDGRPSFGLVVGPFTGNRVADLLVIHGRPPHEVYRNDRLWNYRKPEGWDALLQVNIDAAIAVDTDAVGRFDLYTIGADSLARWRLNEQGKPQATRLAAVTHRGAASVREVRRAQLAVADVLGDGTLTALFGDDVGWRCVGLTGDYPALYQAESPELASWSLFNQDPAKGPAVIGFEFRKGPLIWRPGKGRFPFMSLSFSGKHDVNTQLRSNASGIGTTAAIRVDSRWTAVNTYRQQSGPGQSLQPVAVGLGGHDATDFVSVEWSDGVLETEMDLAGGKLHRIEEKNRIPTSCPLLFVWDGQKFRFIADLLGVGGLGYAIGPGEYAPVRPWEFFLLPAGSIEPQKGRFQIKLAEPMEEMTYLDSVALAAYDLPPGWHMTLDERMGENGPAPTGEPRFFHDEMLPAKALNDRGQDVTADVIAADLVPAPPGRKDPHFIGRNEEHWIELTFPRPIDSHTGAPLLVANGWLEYPYSQTMFAAWQAHADYRSPTLEARDRDGKWQTVLKQWGYPAGMPREMSLPLDHLPAGCTQIRLRTNEEIYWDRLAIAWSEPCPQAKRQPLKMESAVLQFAGFPERTIGPERQTTFDYNKRRQIEDVRHLTGFYTRFGHVEELVSTSDDAVATIGPGEEVHLEFTADATAAPSGWTRRYVLETHGWCKDTDLYTKDGDTVAPLPHRDDSTPETLRHADELHRKFNTRFEAGR